MSFLKGIGVREVVALVVLAVCLALGVAFCNPGSTDGSPARRATEAARTPAAIVEGLAPWSVTYTEGQDLESSVPVGHAEIPELNIAHEAAPSADIKDDAWAVFATTTFTGPAGRYLLDLKYDGEILLLINGEDRQVTPADQKGAIIIPFEQEEGGKTTISLRLRDTGGPAQLSAYIRQ